VDLVITGIDRYIGSFSAALYARVYARARVCVRALSFSLCFFPLFLFSLFSFFFLRGVRLWGHTSGNARL
jgi:hypothetical protein